MKTPRSLLFLLLAGSLLFSVTRGKAQTGPTEALTFAPVADTYVESAAPATTFNTDPRLRVDADPVRVSYLRFAVAGLNGRPVQKARLRLGVAGASTAGGTIHRIADNGWNEATVTFDTRPAVDGPGLHTLGAITIGQVAEFILDGAITGDGTYSFALDSASIDAASYNSAAATSGQKPALVITVPAGPNPTVTIGQPAPGAQFFAGDSVTFQGTATDAVDGTLSAAIAWRSDLQGALGTGATVGATLVRGVHTITADVTDGDGFGATARVIVTVSPPPPANTEPLVTITEPAAVRTLTAGEPIAFAGSAADLEDGVLTARLAWTSDRDGALGTGGSFTRPLTAGTHRLTASVTDSGHLTGTAGVSVTVVAPPIVELLPVADTFVDATAATSAFGTTTLLRANANPRTTYLRFQVAGVGTQDIRRAILRLQVDTGTSANSDSGGTVQRISNTTWDERTTTYNSRPAVDGAVLATVGAVVAGQTVEFDVTAAVTGDGPLSLALVSRSSNTVDYRARESATPPRLVITLAGNGPRVAITAPANQAVFTTGTPIPFTASATDVEDGDLSAGISWTSSLGGVLGTGASLTTAALGTGTHTITAAVTDRDGRAGRAEITITVRDPNTAPRITITAPAPGSSVAAGTLVALAASALDDFDQTLTLRWSSSVHGPLGTGSRLTVALGEGTHTLTCVATDSDGASGQASVALVVTPTPPTVTITAPAAGTIAFAGTPLTFAGSAADARGGDLSAGLAWTSTLDGPIGTGPSFASAGLSVGTHAIRAAVTSAAGLTGQAERNLVVRPPNAAPRLAIQQPGDGAALLGGKPILLAATATDTEDGDLSAAVRWTSSRDGALGTGAIRTVPSLSVGSHVFTAAVTDRDGASTTASVTVTVVVSMLSITAEADTYVDSASPTKVFGAATSVIGGSSPVRQAFFRFPVMGTTGFSIERALLRLTVSGASSDGSRVGGTVNGLSNNDWSEAATTYTTRPAIDGPAFATKGAVKPKQVVEFDVTAGLPGDGLYSFALTSTNTDWVKYQSRQATTGRPQLVIMLTQNTPPAVAVTAPANGTRVTVGTAVTLAASATDAESGTLSAQVSWTSSLSGALGTGATLTVPALAAGSHTITARVTDPSGASAEAAITMVVNHPPVLRMSAPLDGTILFASQLPLALAATAIDQEDGKLGAAIRWSSSLDGPLGTGTAVAAGALRPGPHTIIAAVTDAHGARAEARASVRVRPANTAPVVTITAPPANGSTPAGTSATLTATVTDDFDTALAGQIAWTSSRDGALGTGPSITRTLTEGRHTLFAAVTDSDGVTGTAQIPFTVSPTPPIVTMTAPPVGALLFAERPLTFGGTATDATDGTISATLIWSSDRDGLIGAGAGFTTSRLSAGTHTITAAVTDAGGLRSQAQRIVMIRSRNTPPMVAITAPATGAALLTARRLPFTATASDAENGTLDAAIAWSSSRDGALGTGPALVLSTLTAGAHVITASVTDAAGETVTAAVAITLSPSTVTLPAVADTTVDASAPSTAVGGAALLTADGSPVKQVFLRFAVTGLEPFAIGRARLRLTVGTASANASDQGGTLYTISNTTWPEATTTYATRPALDGMVVAATDSVGVRKVVDFDVTAVLHGDGLYSFVLMTSSTNDVAYQSREAASGQPQLILELRQPTDAQVAITAPVSGAVVPFDLPVTIAATATDREDGDLSATLSWTSTVEGLLPGGPTFTRYLSPGLHTLTASVVDADGNPGSAAVRLEVQQRDVGIRDFAFGSDVEDGASNEATAQKPESKLWYVDGIWWATLYRPNVEAHRIHRLDPVTQQWIDTGVHIDERAISRQDVLWDGTKLYMASRCHGLTPQNRLLRYSYSSSTKTWHLDSGFPVDIPGGGTESMSIAKDSQGRLWLAYTLANTVLVSHSLATDRDWSEEITLPVGTGEETALFDDDIATVVALPNEHRIGVFWSNQLTKSFYFAVHTDGAATDDSGAWQLETIEEGGKFADDHFNLKVASDGRVFAAVKTSYGVNGEPLNGLLVRSAAGTWSPLYPTALVEQNPTRELVMLDEVQRKVFVFYSLDHKALYYKVSDMDTIAFPEGDGIPLIVSTAAPDISNPASTKQNVTPSSGLVVLASSRQDNSYWHNLILPMP